MQFLLSLGMLLYLSFGVLAIPMKAGNRLQGRSFTVPNIRRGNHIAGPAALRKAYRKFGIDATKMNGVDVSDFEPFGSKKSASTKNTNAAASNRTGAVTATSIDGDIEFVSPVTIGGQTLDMNFDTGSSDFWVLNSRLPANQRSNRTVYEPCKSKTFKDIANSTFKIAYGDSSFAYGGVGQDTVSIGGVEVKEQVMGLPIQISESFVEDLDSNGLVGLGFPSINTIKPKPAKTFFDNVLPHLDLPVFTSRLVANGVGEYEFGTIDRSKYKGDLFNTSIDASNGFWEFRSAKYAIDGGSFTAIKEVQTAIADTGTSLMMVSPDVAKAYYQSIPSAVYANNAGGYIYPCKAKLPALAVAVGDEFSANIPGELIHFSEVGTNSTTGETVCFGGVQSNAGSSVAIYGDTFLKALYVVFDYRGPTLSFAAPA